MVFIHSRGSLVLLTTSLLVILSILIQPVYGARYVFTAFTSTSESNMFVYTSTDATNFSLLKGPAYQPNGTLIRDPSPLLHTDGRYYISYTTSWENRMFAIASSANLLDWKLHTTVQIPDTTVARTWAPELWKDPKTGRIHIIVSLSPNLSQFRAHLFTATDNTLLRWSGPQLLQGISPNYIDTFLVYHRATNTYHAFTKNETAKYVEHAVASNILGPWRFVQTGNFAGWGRAEGPCLTTLPDGRYRMYMDGYDSGKYIYSDSADLYAWSAFQTLPGGLSGFVRHGTVLRVE